MTTYIRTEKNGCLGECARTGRGGALVSRVLLAVLAFALLTAAACGRSAAADPAGEERKLVPAPDFTLLDQYGAEHTLSDYQGKVVFLNFWTTWCPWCVLEMPDIEGLYHDTGENEGDVVILGIGAPSSYDSVGEAGIISFLQENGCTYPVLMDTTGDVFNTYGASSLPTTWLIRTDGMLMGYIAGALSREQMEQLIEMTREGVLPDQG